MDEAYFLELLALKVKTKQVKLKKYLEIFMSTIYGSIRNRPTRIGFLVNPRDMASIKKVMRLNTCLWGGTFNPIIPVGRNLPKAWRTHPRLGPTGLELAEGLLNFFEPDVFVETSPGLGKKIGISNREFGFADSRLLGFDKFNGHKKGVISDFYFGLNCFEVY